MEIINISEKLDAVIAQHALEESASVYQNEFAISKTSELKKALQGIENDERVLKIGVVGRVKAGKSSLLNALIFDGKSVLPKAATPMTAALTVLEYSEETKAEIDFFTEEDLKDIKKDYELYNKELESLTKHKYDELLELSKKKKKKAVSEQELKEKANKQAIRALKGNDKLNSAFDQYSKILQSPISLSELSKIDEIKATNITELNEKLLEYVGADGKYMPFTKSVTLKLNEERLKDIQIVDTPGVNDPVTSREERTKEYLKYCDVVLIVSPAGQFLSSEDIDLFDRITQKEGIRELYIVASQVDSQLYGSEKELSGGILPKTIDSITNNLTQQMQSIFATNEYLKGNKSFSNLLENKVVCSSGICHSLYKNFDNQASWDANEQHVWKLLTTQYKDFFDSKENALQNLQLLGNIQNITILIEEVKSNKKKILEEKKESFIVQKLKALQDYTKAITKEQKEKLARVQDGDIDKIKIQIQNLERTKEKASLTIDQEYEDILENFDLELKSLLNDRLNGYFKQTSKDIQESEGSEVETYEVSNSSWYNPFSWGSTKTKSRTYNVVKAGFVRNSLESLTDDIETTIEQDATKFIVQWKKILQKQIIASLRKEVGDDNLDIVLVKSAIKKVIQKVYMPDITYNTALPTTLKKSGTLKSFEAEEFVEEAQNYVSNLKIQIKSDIKKYITTLVSSLTALSLSDSIFKGYAKEMSELEDAIKNKELMVEKYTRIINDLESIKG